MALELFLKTSTQKGKTETEDKTSHHDVDLLLDFNNHGIVGSSNSFKYMVRGVVDWFLGSYEVNMSESAWVWT